MADADTVNMLDFVARQVHQARILMVGAYRPEELGNGEASHSLRKVVDSLVGSGSCCRIALDRLSADETAVLAAAFLEEDRVPTDVADRLQNETEGHPLFVLEILKWMQEQKIARRDKYGRWILRDIDEHSSLIPRSLQNAIQARLAQLSDEDQDILRYAAVEGENFSSEALTCTLDIERMPLLRSLDRLEHRHRMIRYDGEHYRFVHAKIREVLYQDLSPELKCALHQLLGEYKERFYRHRIHEGLFELARHFYEAGAPKKAVDYLNRAGDQASGMYAHQQAIFCYLRALELISDGPGKASLLEKLGDGYHAAGSLDEALATYIQLLELCREELKRAEILRRMGVVCDLAQQREKSLQYFEQAQEELKGIDAPIARVRVLIDLSYLCMAHFNDFNRAEELNRECSQILEGCEPCVESIRLYRNLAGVYGYRARHEKVSACYQERLAQAEEIGNLREVVLACLDWVSATLPDEKLDDVMRYAERAIEVSEQIGDLRLMAEGLSRKGGALMRWEQQWNAAEPPLRESLEICLRMGYVHPLADLLHELARIYLKRDQAQEAQEMLMRGIERLLDLKVEGIYLIRCFTRAVEDLQHTCEIQNRPEVFVEFYRRIRLERPDALEEAQPQQWLLEPVSLTLDDRWREDEAESWTDRECPPGWIWSTDERDLSRYCPVFGEEGLEIQITHFPRHIVQDYERNYEPPRLARTIEGDCTVRVCLSAVDEKTPKSGGVIAWKDSDNFALLAVDLRDEVQFYIKKDGIFKMVGRGHMEGKAHWLGFQWEGSQLISLCSLDGQDWYSAGQVRFEGNELQFGIYPHSSNREYGEISLAARYGPFQIARKGGRERAQTMENSTADEPAYSVVLPQEELAALCRVSRTINATLDLEELLERVLDVALETTGAERGLVLLREDASSDMRIAVARNMDGETVRDATEISRKIVADVIQGGQPIIALDAGDDEQFQPYESVVLHRIRSVLCLPLRIHDQLTGTLYLDHRAQVGIFAETSLPFYQGMADQIALAVENARLYNQVREENLHLRREVEGRYQFEHILGNSPAMKSVFALLEKVIESTSSVVITGESGTGKELVARAIHYEGARREKRFVAENCAALSEQLLETELFGHVQGAFTGATRTKKGLFEVADGGTLFLDEITEASQAMQTKLLRALEEKEVRRLGETEPRKVDVRLLAATSKNLLEEVNAGRFRADLYYRLKVLHVSLPPLRERREDIPELARHFLEKYGERNSKNLPGFSREVLATLRGYDWPGNVRELRNEVERMAALVEEGGTISQEFLSESLREGQAAILMRKEGESLNEALTRIRKTMIEGALRQCGGNRTRAAELLGISRSNLHMMVKRLKIE